MLMLISARSSATREKPWQHTLRQYALQDGDTVTWVYTCELGRDVGSGGWTEGE